MGWTPRGPDLDVRYLLGRTPPGRRGIPALGSMVPGGRAPPTKDQEPMPQLMSTDAQRDGIAVDIGRRALEPGEAGLGILRS